MRFFPDFQRSKPARARQAFTLLEMLVSTTILVILVLALGQIITNVSRIWRTSYAGMEKADSGRAVCEIISREMGAALLPADRGDMRSLQFIVNPPGIDSTFNCRDTVFWQAPIAFDSSSGEVAEVGYFVKWDLTKPANPRAILCRFYVNPTDTANYLIHTDPASWLTTAIINNVASATSATDPPYQGLFIENVIGLWVTCMDRDGVPITRTATGASYANAFDSRLGYIDNRGTIHSPGSLPAAIEFSFILIDSQSAARITPALSSAITSLVSNSGSATQFITQAQGNSSLGTLFSALKPYTTRFYLQDSK